MANAPTATPTATPATSRDVRAATILQRSVCLTLHCHWLGNDRKVELGELVAAATDEEERQLAVEEEQFHATKKLIPTKEISPVARWFGVAKAMLRAKAIPANRVFGERSFLIPLALVEEVDADLVHCETELKKAAHALAHGRYLQAVEEQKKKLGALFKAGDYLTPNEVEAKFAMEWDYVSFQAPDNLETVSHALAMNAERRHTDKLAAAFDDWMIRLRASALTVVTELEERLKPGPDGKPKVVRDTALRDLSEFQRLLPKRNQVGDDALDKVMARLARRTAGLDIEMLRDDEAVKAELLRSTQAAKRELAALVETGRRGISFSGSLT